jgi:hypothetical protein
MGKRLRRLAAQLRIEMEAKGDAWECSLTLPYMCSRSKTKHGPLAQLVRAADS